MTLAVLLLGIAVAVLWSRVGSLQSKQERLARELAELKQRRTAGEAPTVAAEPPAAPKDVEGWPVPDRVESSTQVRSPMIDGIERAVRGYFTGGNLVVRVGIIVLFFGVGFLLKYAAERVSLSIQMRLSGVALGAVVLFVIGWRLRHRRRGFSLALQGGAVGVLYLTLFAALHLYQLLPAGLTFALMAGLGVAACLLAVRQDSLALSMLGATGGFLAPLLASSGAGSHVVLFGYYALLDAFIVSQAWFKAWRPLNLLAFVFTFGVGAFWGATNYDPSLYATTQPFLLFFLVAFVAIAVLFALRRAPQLTHYVDGTLVFGTPAVAMALQMQLVGDFTHGRAISATVAGVFYLVLALWLHRARRETQRLLTESFLSIGVALLTLAVPLWFDDVWTAAIWALEGAALFWIGLRQQRQLAATVGVLLQVGAALVFLGQVRGAETRWPVFNVQFVGALMLAAAGLCSARCASKPHALLKSFDQLPANLLLAWGLAWWLYAGQQEVDAFVRTALQPATLLGLCAVTALACSVLVRPLAWPALRVPALLLLPAMLCAAYAWALLERNPSRDGGWLVWPASLAVLWLSLKWHELSLPPKWGAVWHGLTAWLLSLLVSWELGWQVAQFTRTGTVWAAAAWALPPALLLVGINSSALQSRWPLRPYLVDFRGWVALGLAGVLGIWALWLSSSAGYAAPLPYLPILNPLDIAVGFALAAIAFWLRRTWKSVPGVLERPVQRGLIGALVAVVFVWLNAILLRTMHHWTGVPYQLADLLSDTGVQAALSIFWTLLALGAMLWANRSGLRVVWFGGASLMAVVIAKLFLVDLARVGTIERIVSFLVVGGLMLVIGYFSPLPPVVAQARAKDA